MRLRDALTVEERALLERLGPGVDALEALARRLEQGALGANRVQGRVEPPRDGDVERLGAGDARLDRWRALGVGALARGEIGIVLLNGGMATRFGGRVKGTVPVGECSFLGLKLRDARRIAERIGGPIPAVILMNSHATAAPTHRHLRANDGFGVPPDRIWCFEQQMAVRLRPDGQLFLGGDGRPSFYGPGHGDLLAGLRRSGLLERFQAEGGRVLLMSNVDNALATLDPVLLGWHLQSGAVVGVEVVDRRPGDTGGVPARVDDHLQIVESFRLPAGLAGEIPVFNTNTLWFDARAFERDLPLTWLRVEKTVGGAPVVQLERLIGEMTAFLPSAFVRVERDGPSGRFAPVKTPEELEIRRAALLASWSAR